MIEENEVGVQERLARFATASSHLRTDNTPRPALFLPAPHVELSVTSHKGLTEQELWEIGKTVTKQIGPERTLYGRADVVCGDYQKQKLRVISDPVVGNPNHCNVVDWPADKSAQMLIAAEIAKVATGQRL